MITYFKIRDLLLDSGDLSWYQAETVQPVLHHLQPVQHFLHIHTYSTTNKFSGCTFNMTENLNIRGLLKCMEVFYGAIRYN